ncbi:hypothetical protein ACK3TF_005868 [Chlorella vulgaris]
MSPAPATLWGTLVGAVAMLVLLQGTLSQMHTTVEVFDDSCDAQLQSLWNNYTAPPVWPVAGCDKACLAECYTTLDQAIYSEKKQHCPLQVDIIRCMHVYRATWEKFVSDCALFEYGTSSGAEGEGEGGGSSSSTSSEGEAAPATSEGAAATSEGAAATSEGAAATSEGQAATSEGQAAPATSAGEASASQGGRRRVLLQEAEAALGASGVDTYNGCFPNFKNASEYEMYINGEYVFATSSSTAGIVLSVFFYLGLLLVGLGLPAFIKGPTKKGWAWTKSKIVGVFERKRPVPVVEPPAAAVAKPAADKPAEDSAVAVPAGLPPPQSEIAPVAAAAV